MKRAELIDQGGLYFTEPSSVERFSSGCAVLDCVLSGGWPSGRIINVVGDKSVGKTLLAIEGSANFARRFPSDPIWYEEQEDAFDLRYATQIGMPEHAEFINDCFTVEDWSKRLEDAVAHMIAKKRKHGLFVLDSLDAMSSEAELKRTMDDPSFGAEKAKKMSELFRRVNKRMAQSGITLFIISQVRDNIGVTFGQKYTRTGGRALDFYASVIIYLAHVEQITRTVKGVKRTVGVTVKAKCTKNKVGVPFRDCQFDLLFGYGIDDITSNLEWLRSVKRLDVLKLSSEEDAKRYLKEVDKMTGAQYQKERERIAVAVRKLWSDIEKGFAPTRQKYI